MLTNKDIQKFTKLYEELLGIRLNKQESFMLAEKCLGLVDNVIQEIDQSTSSVIINKQSHAKSKTNN